MSRTVYTQDTKVDLVLLDLTPIPQGPSAYRVGCSVLLSSLANYEEPYGLLFY